MSFHLTAKNITLEGTLLSADCQKLDGEWIRTSLELNDWVKNVDGDLQWGWGNFAESSSNIALKDNHILTAVCKREDGTTKESELDLGDWIDDVEGLWVRVTQ